MKSKRSPSEKQSWPGTFVSLVQGRYADYKINTAVHGNLTELYRDADALHHLQSTIWRHDQYSHCFAVSLTLVAPSHLNSPFWAGGRFDHNHTIFQAFEHDLGVQVRGPNKIPGLQSTHAHRSGFAEIVKQCTANAEIHLAAHYRRTLVTAAPLLLRCTELIAQDPRILTDKVRRSHNARSIDLCARDFANRPNAWRDIPESELPEAIIASAPDKFAPYVSDFVGIAAKLRTLV